MTFMEACERLCAADREAWKVLCARLRVDQPKSNAAVLDYASYTGSVTAALVVMRLPLGAIVPIASLAPDPINEADKAPTVLHGSTWRH